MIQTGGKEMIIGIIGAMEKEVAILKEQMEIIEVVGSLTHHFYNFP